MNQFTSQLAIESKSSPDPVIQRLAMRWSALEAERTVLVNTLYAYHQHQLLVMSADSIPSTDHYDMLDEKVCGCYICTDWTQRRKEFTDALQHVPKGHKWTICACPSCRFVGRMQLNLLAASNKRDLFIEMSFHARYHSNYGDIIMLWVERELKNPQYTDNWCAQEMSRFPMERWIKRCEQAVSGQISGSVFVNSTMVTDMSVNLGSSLMADAYSQYGE